MASIKISIPHQLSQQEVLARTKGLLAKLQREQKDIISNVKENWKDGSGKFQFTAKGFDVSGLIHITNSSIDINAAVPFAVALFKGKIKQAIEKNAKLLLS